MDACYYPLLYYSCASAFHQCKDDATVTVIDDDPRESFDPYSEGPDTDGEYLKVPQYPCMDFCTDPEVQACARRLIDAANETLQGLPDPVLADYIGNITHLFNCSALADRQVVALCG